LLAGGKPASGATANLNMADCRLGLLLRTRGWISAGELPTIGAVG
jgi:hypothetical protein